MNRRGGRLPILLYHSLDTSGAVVAVAPRVFEKHLARLRAGGYTVLPLREALDWLHRGGAGRVAAMTFDDGYASVQEEALPRLEACGWRATVYAVGDYVGRDNDWPGQPAFVPRAPLMDWDGLRALAERGWEIGGHTRSHPDLRGLGPEALEDQLVQSKRQLERRLGVAVETLAYPYGYHDRPSCSLARQTYRAACTTTLRFASRVSDRWRLERLEMWYFAGARTQALLASPLMVPYLRLRAVGRELRARLLDSRERGLGRGHP
jgi:peptidoglycan/xylan/chitin deacetylase (PgdA/CDA1 family)